MALIGFDIHDGIVFVTINNPPVNALVQPVRQRLLEVVREIETSKEAIAIVLRGVGRTFVAGADINELGKPQKPYLPDILNEIASSRCPWVAALHGSVLGGGLELAMACHGRVAAAGAKLGLPEVTLGVIPGAGGTVRLPRLIPMQHAITMATSGKPISATQALEWGLVDDIPGGSIEDAAAALAINLASAGRASLLERPVLISADINWEEQEKAIRSKARGANAPLEALAALKEAMLLQPEIALENERERFLRLADTEESRALRHVFFAERAAGRSLKAIAADPADLRHIGIIGGGTMGAAIATAFLLAGSKVILVEQDDEAVARALERVRETIGESARRGAVAKGKDAEALGRLVCSNSLEALKDCELVIEAVFEDLNVKTSVFERLDAVMSPNAVLATNTSYLDVDAIAASTRYPERVLGLHFFSPAHVMKLLEVVRGRVTGERALATAGALAKHLQKIAVVSRVCDGFIGNRIMASYRRECELMLEEGATPSDVDAAMREFGFAMGIFEVQDMSGLDIAWAQRKAKRSEKLPEGRAACIADRLCEAGRLGRKAGRGWYDYSHGRPEPDAEVIEIILDESRKAGCQRRPFTGAEIITRILQTMQREGLAILEEQIAESAADIDVVMINGYGFPRFRGGPMHMLEMSKAHLLPIA